MLLNNEINMPVDVISGPVDPGFFGKLNASTKRAGALFVGRLLPHKGVDRLIEAAPQELDVTIAGTAHDANYLDYLKTLAKRKRVHFVDSPGASEMLRLYESAAIHVAPSVTRDYRGNFHPNSELMGLTTLEALCRGTPVAVADTCSLPSLIDNTVGEVYESTSRLKEILHRVQTGEWTNTYCSEVAYKFATSRYSLRSVGEKLKSSYQLARESLC